MFPFFPEGAQVEETAVRSIVNAFFVDIAPQYILSELSNLLCCQSPASFGETRQCVRHRSPLGLSNRLTPVPIHMSQEECLTSISVNTNRWKGKREIFASSEGRRADNDSSLSFIFGAQMINSILALRFDCTDPPEPKY